MQTLQLQVQDDIYNKLNSKGIDINKKLQDFLFTLANDDYPFISENEAKQRISNAIKRYENDTGIYLNKSDYANYKSKMIDSIKSKYANS